MKKITVAAGLCSLLSISSAAAASSACQTVRFTDPGWTDINATNALASNVLQALGYETQISTLAVPIGFEGLKNSEIDVFLGNWMPAQQKFIDKYVPSSDIEVIRTNLTGAKFTLAVPKYVYDTGIHDFSDLVKSEGEFRKRIYGIEAGAPANQLLQKMIDSGDFGLKKWRLVESGEQGVLSQVKRSVKRGEHIVFLAWEPHPMNTTFELSYLSGGDKYFGPDFGGASIQTLTRRGYSAQCPNVGKLLSNLEFNLTMENQVMGLILDEGMKPAAAAKQWLKANPAVATPWLTGVTTASGGDAQAALEAYLAN